MQQQQTNYTPLLVFAGGYFLFQHFFGKTKEEADAEKEPGKILNLKTEDNPFDIATYKAPLKKNGYRRMTLIGSKSKDAIEAADYIHDGKGWIYDNVNPVMVGIKNASTISDIYVIAWVYKRKYKTDLWTELNSYSKARQGIIFTYINKLPKYVKGDTN